MDFYLSTSRLHLSRCVLSTAFDNVIFVGNLGVMTWNEMIPSRTQDTFKLSDEYSQFYAYTLS